MSERDMIREAIDELVDAAIAADGYDRGDHWDASRRISNHSVAHDTVMACLDRLIAERDEARAAWGRLADHERARVAYDDALGLGWENLILHQAEWQMQHTRKQLTPADIAGPRS